MHLNSTILQLLRSCAGESPHPSADTVLNFPLTEFFYEVLIGGVSINDQFYSLKHLSAVIGQYHNHNPSCQLTAEILLSEGWIAPFIDRWDFSIWPHKELLKAPELSSAHRQRLARLLVYYSDPHSPAQLELWMKIFLSLHGGNRTFEILPHDQQKILLNALISYLERGTIPSPDDENKRIALTVFEMRPIPKNVEFLGEDKI